MKPTLKSNFRNVFLDVDRISHVSRGSAQWQRRHMLPNKELNSILDAINVLIVLRGTLLSLRVKDVSI